MSKITSLKAREIIDSRGNPTLEVDIELEGSFKSRAAVPSGASTGSYEAVELRDGDKNRYLGRGVLKACENVEKIVKPKLIGQEIETQKDLDKLLIELDGTENKKNLGANAILGISVAFAKAEALKQNLQLFEYFGKISGKDSGYKLPLPMMNILNGGKHADSNVDIQEFMIVPFKNDSFKENLRMCVEIYHGLKHILHDEKKCTAVGDEGGFAPNLSSNEEALRLIMLAIQEANYKANKDVGIGLDVAATELYSGGLYHFTGENKSLSADQLIHYYQKLVIKYPIISIEDGLAEDDFDAWPKLTSILSEKVKTVGDDLYVTNVKRLEIGIKQKLSNAILIKLNQIGTVTETINTIKMAQDNNMTVIVSHRSGETEDTTIAHLAVGLGAEYIKSGAPARGERVNKYNELLRIEESIKNL